MTFADDSVGGSPPRRGPQANASVSSGWPLSPGRVLGDDFSCCFKYRCGEAAVATAVPAHDEVAEWLATIGQSRAPKDVKLALAPEGLFDEPDDT